MRTFKQWSRFGAPLVAVAVLAACSGEAALGDADEAKAGDEPASQQRAPQQAAAAPAPARQPAQQVCQECGTVSAIEPVQVRGEGSGAGAIGGAVAGGVVGSQIGGGSGRRIATVIGAIGGGYAGHKTEERMRSSTVYRVSVRMDNGRSRVIEVADASQLRPGQTVSVYGDTIVLR